MSAGHDPGAHGGGALTVRCACGWEWAGDVESVIAATQEHGRRTHNMESTREQVLAMARPVDDAPDARGPEPPTAG
jgi:predicted small metal-binding protein